PPPPPPPPPPDPPPPPPTPSLLSSIFLSSASNFTLPVGLNALFSTPDYIWGRMMAASLVTALPVVIMYALSERFIKSGLTAGGVKG
ncbi:hypothetical protein NQU33_23825, partial [Escherichia coli]|nr:hypothetical protein [Escherichia coli]